MASKERRAQKPKIEITLQRSANFEEVRAKKQAIVRLLTYRQIIHFYRPLKKRGFFFFF
jgi:hypothetical protein